MPLSFHFWGSMHTIPLSFLRRNVTLDLIGGRNPKKLIKITKEVQGWHGNLQYIFCPAKEMAHCT